jgi:alkyl sulfatase BDS1-like metallo-beta-lactamase superfamily hydrolase
VLIYTPDLTVEPADLTITTSKAGLAKLVLGSATPADLQHTGDLTVENGDPATLAVLFELVEQFPFWFNIITP